jgi:hypothetical protein
VLFTTCDLLWFKHTYLSLIAKQVLATYINHFESTNPGTNQYWRHMRKHGRDPIRAQTNDPCPDTLTTRPSLPLITFFVHLTIFYFLVHFKHFHKKLA